MIRNDSYLKIVVKSLVTFKLLHFNNCGQLSMLFHLKPATRLDETLNITFGAAA
jgi:hypothetical protein